MNDDYTEVTISIDDECGDCGAYFSGDIQGFMGDSETISQWICADCGYENNHESYGWNDLRDEYGV